MCDMHLCISVARCRTGISSVLAMERLQSCTKTVTITLSCCDILILYFNGLVQDCSISIANALEILQSCTEPSVSPGQYRGYHFLPWIMIHKSMKLVLP